MDSDRMPIFVVGVLTISGQSHDHSLARQDVIAQRESVVQHGVELLVWDGSRRVA